jgi:hypothetical protein
MASRRPPSQAPPSRNGPPGTSESESTTTCTILHDAPSSVAALAGSVSNAVKRAGPGPPSHHDALSIDGAAPPSSVRVGDAPPLLSALSSRTFRRLHVNLNLLQVWQPATGSMMATGSARGDDSTAPRSQRSDATQADRDNAVTVSPGRPPSLSRASGSANLGAMTLAVSGRKSSQVAPEDQEEPAVNRRNPGPGPTRTRSPGPGTDSESQPEAEAASVPTAA